MKKNSTTSKVLPRGRNGGRKPNVSTSRKPTQANILIPAEELDAFWDLMPSATDRNQLISKWVRAIAYSLSHPLCLR
ncbi:hypothetical protein [Microcoleus sp. bin38.metabat.b11b12b14.051]|uniref:hypothetical protein n=1 Tax=Microcoleus sp. bin38.metabat.b11b12b14.051 TaxID=2742709 RepID=UPI0025FF0CFE|nr:hypothetical protein [Microcoleus sp. bin38.metabat.b11b12b14.051]